MEDLKSTQKLTSELNKQVISEVIAKYGEGFSSNDVLEYATPKNSPLHDFLEWDNKKAGHEYRLWQCRQIISRLVLEEDQGVRAIISFKLNEEQQRGYWQVETIMKDKELKKAALKQIYQEAMALLQKYDRFKEIFEIISPKSLETFKTKYL